MFRRVAGRASAATALAATVSLICFVPVANAAYSGGNGDIAFSSTRNNNIAVYQVDPNDPVGTGTEDAAATTDLTLGLGDVEPFYSQNGQTVYFSADRNENSKGAYDYAIYSIPQATPETATQPALELSAVAGQEVNNDFAPSVAPDNETVVFNRNNEYIDTLWASAGPGSVCTLYTPPAGLAAGGSDGAASRIVFNPVNPSEVVYVDSNGDLHLLTGITFPGGTNPCASNQTGALTDINLSTLAFPAGSEYASGADANPDWSPNGQQIIFDSTRGGGDTLFIMNVSPTTPTAYPLWPSMAATGGTESTEPVFSPTGNEISFVQPRRGTSIYDQMLVTETDGQWGTDSSAIDLSQQMTNGVSLDSEPDWQPIPPSTGQIPESPYIPALPLAAILVCASLVVLPITRNRRLLART